MPTQVLSIIAIKPEHEPAYQSANHSINHYSFELTWNVAGNCVPESFVTMLRAFLPWLKKLEEENPPSDLICRVLVAHTLRGWTINAIVCVCREILVWLISLKLLLNTR